MKIIIDGESVEIPSGGTDPTGASIPTGGTTGQVLAKASDTDYDTHWVDEPQALTQEQADEQYLKLSGGTMTGGILMSQKNAEIWATSSTLNLRGSGTDGAVRIGTGNSYIVVSEIGPDQQAQIGNVAFPGNRYDAANKEYVDEAVAKGAPSVTIAEGNDNSFTFTLRRSGLLSILCSYYDSSVGMEKSITATMPLIYGINVENVRLSSVDFPVVLSASFANNIATIRVASDAGITTYTQVVCLS